jgi:hypothetical protein
MTPDIVAIGFLGTVEAKGGSCRVVRLSGLLAKGPDMGLRLICCLWKNKSLLEITRLLGKLMSS